MDERIISWLRDMYEREIDEAVEDIRNERLREIGHNGEDPNPHTENIMKLREYIYILRELHNGCGNE